jgi:hypothetical protein
VTVPLYNLTDTWTANGQDAILMNATQGAFTGGNLLRLQATALDQFKVGQAGQVSIDPQNSGTLTAPSLIFANFGIGLFAASGSDLRLAFSGQTSTYIDFFFDGATSTSNFRADRLLLGAGTGDTILWRDAAGIIAQRNAANAQSLRVYNTFTDVNNYERGVLDWNATANTLTIGTQAAGTGVVRTINFVNGANIVGLNVGANGPVFAAGASSYQMHGNGFFYCNGTGFDFSHGDISLSRVAVSVLGIGTGTIGSNAGWFQWGGQSRVTADVAITSNITLANVAGLSVNVQAGRTYAFEADIIWTDAAAGGIQLAIGGTATATAILYDGWIVDSAANGIKGNAQGAALGAAVANAATTGTAGHAQIRGTITVNAAGTLTVQAAQSVSNATATTIKRGSSFYVYDTA